MKLTISKKLTGLTLLIALFMGGGVIAYTIAAQRSAILGEVEARGRAVAETLGMVLIDPLYDLDIRELATLTESIRENSLDLVAVYACDAAGNILADGTAENAARDQRLAALSPDIDQIRQTGRTVVRRLNDSIVVSGPVATDDGRILGFVHLELSLTRTRAAMRENLLIVLTLAGGLMAILLPCTLLMARSFSLPIRQMVDGTRRIREGDFSARVSITRDDELGVLAQSINEMAATLADRDSEIQALHGSLEEKVRTKTQELQATLKELAEASEVKSRFLANMSHEIRTPMTAILGYTDLLADPAHVDEDFDETVQTIRRNGEHLLTIINDILDISKLESGQMRVESVACSPVQIVNEVCELMQGRATGKGLTLDFEAVGLVPRTIRSDPTRLRQILVNLVGNAVKFTEYGGIRVLVKLADPSSDRNPNIRFEVIDTGIGLTDGQIETLFQPFHQGDASTTRQFGGTGLGLTISKQFAELLGGDITVKSIPRHGTTFTATVATGPLDGVDLIDGSAALQESPSPKLPTVSGRSQTLGGRRILLAEDGPDNQRLIVFHLRKAGAHVEVAENGQIAYDKATEAWHSGEPYDVILMDMQMPEMDGYTATRKLRNDGYVGLIVALTAHAMAGDRKKCIDAGCDDYTTKPINKETLIRICESDASNAQSAA